MNLFIFYQTILLMVIHSSSATLHLLFNSGGNACKTNEGYFGVCKKYRSCYGATRLDRGNSHDCSRLHTCCTNYDTEKAIQRRSWSRDSYPYPYNRDHSYGYNKDYSHHSFKKDYPYGGEYSYEEKHSYNEEYPYNDGEDSYKENSPPSKEHSSGRNPKTQRLPSSSSNRSSSTPSPPSSSIPLNIPNLRVKGCGTRKVLTDFIVGGRESRYWPWMASIFYRPRGSRTGTFQCGGTIISKRYILTAAHCLFEGNRVSTPARVTVRVGGLTPRGDGRSYRVSEIKIHENYKPQLHYDDIALLKLTQDIESKNVVPVCLPSPGWYNSNFFQRNGTIIGWGLTESAGISTSSVLREAEVPIVSNSRCRRRYEGISALSLPRGIVETHVCAGSNDGSVDACQGDSGGPLLLEDSGKRWIVIGIVSFGFGCAEPEYPGVYTRVPKYLNWLRRNADIPARSS